MPIFCQGYASLFSAVCVYVHVYVCVCVCVCVCVIYMECLRRISCTLPLVGNDVIEKVNSFPYLRSMMAEDGKAHEEVDRQIAGALSAFVALHCAVFEAISIHYAKTLLYTCVYMCISIMFL